MNGSCNDLQNILNDLQELELQLNSEINANPHTDKANYHHSNSPNFIPTNKCDHEIDSAYSDDVSNNSLGANKTSSSVGCDEFNSYETRISRLSCDNFTNSQFKSVSPFGAPNLIHSNLNYKPDRYSSNSYSPNINLSTKSNNIKTYGLSNGLTHFNESGNNGNSTIESDSNKKMNVVNSHVISEKEIKIQIALQKLKEANIKKMYVKIYMRDGGAKCLLVDENQTCGQICRILVEKNHIKQQNEQIGILTNETLSSIANWTLIEHLPDLYMERVLEDHENLIENISFWSRESSNKLLFLDTMEKYEMFNISLINGNDIDIKPVKNDTKIVNRLSLINEPNVDKIFDQNGIYKEYIGKKLKNPTNISSMAIFEGYLHIKSHKKKTWKKQWCLLRSSGLYFCTQRRTAHQPAKINMLSDFSCLHRFDSVNVYYGFDWKKQYKAPTNFGFALKIPQVQIPLSNHTLYFCVENEENLTIWVNGIRLAKYGETLFHNCIKAHANIVDNIVHHDCDDSNSLSFNQGKDISHSLNPQKSIEEATFNLIKNNNDSTIKHIKPINGHSLLNQSKCNFTEQQHNNFNSLKISDSPQETDQIDYQKILQDKKGDNNSAAIEISNITSSIGDTTLKLYDSNNQKSGHGQAQQISNSNNITVDHIHTLYNGGTTANNRVETIIIKSKQSNSVNSHISNPVEKSLNGINEYGAKNTPKPKLPLTGMVASVVASLEPNLSIEHQPIYDNVKRDNINMLQPKPNFYPLPNNIHNTTNHGHSLSLSGSLKPLPPAKPFRKSPIDLSQPKISNGINGISNKDNYDRNNNFGDINGSTPYQIYDNLLQSKNQNQSLMSGNNSSGIQNVKSQHVNKPLPPLPPVRNLNTKLS